MNNRIRTRIKVMARIGTFEKMRLLTLCDFILYDCPNPKYSKMVMKNSRPKNVEDF